MTMQELLTLSGIFAMLHEYLIPFILTISLVVFVHEYGHYWVARRCGVRIMVFSIGFGPEIWGWNDKHGTRWKLAAIPLGGYVKMFGDEDAASTPDGSVYRMSEAEKRIAFYHQKVWKRIAIVLAGPAANYAFTILLMIIMFATYGEPYTEPVAEIVMPDTAAAAAGIKPGDRIKAIDGRKIERFLDLQRITMLNTGTPMHLEIEREGEIIALELTPRLTDMVDRFGMKHKTARIGIASTTGDYRQLRWPDATLEAFAAALELTRETLTAVYQMAVGLRGAEELGGALRIAKMTGDVVKSRAIPDYIWFVILISLNLGLVNLFPIPLMDGGHVAFYLYEMLRGKPLSERVQEYAARIGAILLVSLLIFTTWNDIVQISGATLPQ